MVSNAVRSRRRAAARSAREAAATEVANEETTEQTTEPTVEEAPTTEPTTEATPAEKPKRTRSRKAPEPEPEPEPEPAARTYTAWAAPVDRETALLMLRPPKGRGLIKERDQAAERVTRNRNRADSGPTAGNTIQAIGWHDRTVAKVLIALGIVGTAAAKREATEVMEQAQKLTGFGTAKATTRPGKAAFEMLQAAEAKKRPSRKGAAA